MLEPVVDVVEGQLVVRRFEYGLQMFIRVMSIAYRLLYKTFEELYLSDESRVGEGRPDVVGAVEVLVGLQLQVGGVLAAA